MKKVVMIWLFILLSKSLIAQSLFDAVLEGNEFAVSALVNSRNVNEVYEGGLTPLMIAAYDGNKKIAEILMHNGAKVDVTDVDRWTAAHYAARNGQHEMLFYLIDQGANINKQAEGGWTVLMIHSLFHYDEMIFESLVNLGADETIQNYEGKTSLEIVREYKKSVRYYYEQAALNLRLGKYDTAIKYSLKTVEITKDEAGEFSEYHAAALLFLSALYRTNGEYEKAYPKNIKAIEILEKINLTESAEYIKATNYLAVLYRIKGDYDKSERLFIQSIEMKESEFSNDSFGWAFYQNNYAELLIERGDLTKAQSLLTKAIEVILNTPEKNSTFYPRFINNLAMVYELKGDYSEAEGLYREAIAAIKAVSGKNHPEYETYQSNLKQLINEKEILNASKSYNKPEESAGTVYVNESKQINNTDDHGLTALMYAVDSGDINTVMEVLNQGAEVDFQNNEGIAAIHLAALFGYYDILKHFISIGSDINLKTNQNWTPLMLLVANAYDEDVYNYMLENGADEDIINKDGMNAKAIAKEPFSPILPKSRWIFNWRVSIAIFALFLFA